MKVKVNAKLNLTLNVFNAAGGFHNIDSVATSVNVFDVVEVLARSDNTVTVAGLNQIPAERNAAYKAACAFVKRFNTCGADIIIDKRIPMGAGMGGSSADTAAVVYCMCKLFNVNVNSKSVHALCATLGSDVNFMLRGGLGRLKGKGDDVFFSALKAPLYFALTTFNTSMSAAEVYSQWDSLGATQAYVNCDALFKILQSESVKNIAECFNNHLQAAASSLSNYADEYIQFCSKHNLTFNMTGSGSAYYVAYNSEQSAKQTAKLLNLNGFSTIVCNTVPNGVEVL